MQPFGQYGPDRRGMTPEEIAEAERLHRLRNRLGWFLLAMVTLLAVLSLVNTIVAADRAQKQSFENRLTQVTACVANGNTLRQGLRNYITDQIQQVRKTDPELFPQIPRQTFERLIHRRVRDLRAVRDDNFAPLDCLGIYPPLEGQTYPAAILEQAERQHP